MLSFSPRANQAMITTNVGMRLLITAIIVSDNIPATAVLTIAAEPDCKFLKINGLIGSPLSLV